MNRARQDPVPRWPSGRPAGSAARARCNGHRTASRRPGNLPTWPASTASCFPSWTTAKGGVAVAIANDPEVADQHAEFSEGIDDLLCRCAMAASTAFRREVVTPAHAGADRSDYMARALFLADATAAGPVPTRWSARWSSRATASSSGTDITSGRRGTCGGPRARHGWRPAPAAYALLDPRAVQLHGPNRSVRGPDRRRRYSTCCGRCDRSESARQRPGMRVPSEHGVRAQGVSRRRPRQSAALHARAEAAAVRRDEGAIRARMDSTRRRLALDASTSACADRHAQRLRAEIDAIAPARNDSRRQSAACRRAALIVSVRRGGGLRSRAADPARGAHSLDTRPARSSS